LGVSAVGNKDKQGALQIIKFADILASMDRKVRGSNLCRFTSYIARETWLVITHHPKKAGQKYCRLVF